MQDFKQNPKMKSDLPCYKVGGLVSKAPKMKEQAAVEEKEALKKAKSPSAAVVKEKETPVEFAAKSGGRCKKEGGKVKRYKTGGVVGADGKGGDQDKIKKVVAKDKKAASPSAAGGKKPVQKFAFGGLANIAPMVEEAAKGVVTPTTQSTSAPVSSGGGGWFGSMVPMVAEAVQGAVNPAPTNMPVATPMPNVPVRSIDDGRAFAGGTPNFDERAGQFRNTPQGFQNFIQMMRNRFGPASMPPRKFPR